VNVVGEFCPVIKFLSHGSTAISEKKNPCIFTELVSLLSEYISHVLSKCGS
jgi:hypothetical protein